VNAPSYEDYIAARAEDEKYRDAVLKVFTIIDNADRGLITNQELLELLALHCTDALQK
jgi:hypothetical protein